ncbi:MAG: amino acid adenylation domain-containing protein [Gammaproteobacteria bacterium]|nr:amino acid adenylation domain-containing protein [Gammaproteobacteria bacterium]
MPDTGSDKPRSGASPAAVPDLQQIRQAIGSTWTELLGGQPGGENEGFLAAGGDSLLAMQMAGRLSRTLERMVPVSILLANPTADTLARQVHALPHMPQTDMSPVTAAGLPVPSFSQERMWFMHLLAPQASAYNISQVLRLRGDLDKTALSEALDALVTRHEVLRSTFAADERGVMPAIDTDAGVTLEVIDIGGQGSHSSVNAARHALTELSNQPFDLGNGPVFRAALLRLAACDHLLALMVHHIAGDQWSFDVMLRDLACMYNAIRRGDQRTDAPRAASFSAYAAWHRQWFSDEIKQQQLAYWRERLQGLDPLYLATDTPRPPQQSFRGARVRIEFPPALSGALQRVAARKQCTLAMYLLAALKLLIQRHTDCNDIAVGAPIANRHHPGAEHVVGTLVNTLVLRTDLAACRSFGDLLNSVRSTLLEAWEHQDMPFEQLVQALQLERDSSRSPLFSVMFNMLNTPLGDVQLDGLQWSRFEHDRLGAQFDLTITIDHRHDQSIVFEYAADLFERDTMAAMAARFFRLLEVLAQGEDLELAQVDVLTSAELRQLEHWGAGPSIDLSPTVLPPLLDQALTAHAARTALRFGSVSYSYRDLDAASRRVAQRLVTLGLGPGSLVGLCLPRGPGMLIAQLGALRAGVGYVPLDPCYPQSRLRFMAEDAKLSLLVVTEASSRLWRSNIDELLLDPEGAILTPLPPTSAGGARQPGPEDPAYVIYTSGSTGQPKGVIVSHRAVCNFLAAMAVRPGLTPDDRLLAVTTLNFDIALLELLLPLHVGGCVVLASQQELADSHALAQLMDEHDVTCMQATPSTWRMLIESGWPGRPGLRMFVGGEPLSPALARELKARTKEIWNMYGPTETTVWSTCWKLPPGEIERISLGQPVANTRVHVLDRSFRRCPVGAAGEICIGGAGLANGYLARPALTAERFIPDPFGAASGERLYRTGDLGRWRNDGTLEHLGRMDSQVKLRGHRIELGEIESCLARHPAIAGTVTAALRGDTEDARLVAYIVPWEALPPAAELRDFLRSWLPEYMLPQHFVELDAIPLLPNGKVDRAALPSATAERVDQAQRRTSDRAPRSTLEASLLRLWRQLLGIKHIGVNDNFFDLGGHSLLLVRLARAIQQQLGHDCTLPMLFRHSTIASLAHALAQAADAERDALIALQPEGERPPVFCLCGINLYQELADRLGTSRPVYGVFVASELQFLEPDHGGTETPSIEQLASAYLTLIRHRQPTGPYHLVGFSLGGAVALQIAHLLEAQGESTGLLALLDSNVPGPARQSLHFLARRAIRKLVRLLPGRRSGGGAAAANTPEVTAALGYSTVEANETRRTPTAAPEQPFLQALAKHQPVPYAGRAIFVEAARAGTQSSYGWKALVKTLELHTIDADHLGLLRPPGVDQIAKVLAESLAQIDQ